MLRAMSNPDSPRSWRDTVAGLVGLAKDLVAVLRDGSLFLLALLLIVFPTHFNTILVNAGFEEGSVVGFKWKSKLRDSNEALEQAQAALTQLQAKNDELVAALRDAGQAGQGDAKLAERLQVLERENEALKSSSVSAQTRVAESIEANAPLLEKAQASTAPAARGRGDYLVGLQTLGVDDAERLRLNEGLGAAGFGLDTVTYSYPAGERPSWFATRSTVFYYASSAQPMAEQLARLLQERTGQRFVVQRGAGLGVDPARRHLTLYVHYVR